MGRGSNEGLDLGDASLSRRGEVAEAPINEALLPSLRAIRTHPGRILLIAQEAVRRGDRGTTEQEAAAYYRAAGFREPSKWADAFSNARAAVAFVGDGFYAPRTISV